MSARPWRPMAVHPDGPRRWTLVQDGLFGALNVHRKGNGRERRFHTRLKAFAFATRLNNLKRK